MSSFQEVPSSANALQTSNFAHVIFQNVAKSYLPNTHLECHYTLTQFIHPHQKDWVGIFKVSKVSEEYKILTVVIKLLEESSNYVQADFSSEKCLKICTCVLIF
uniref:SKICH domain-containing protein n=1 Tax=Anas zonorhyncha TaxID=75864 RepID=A0A8B9V4P3_9AVES